MQQEYVIKGENLSKKFKGFTLDIPELKIPKGFATALIGENGAGNYYLPQWTIKQVEEVSKLLIRLVLLLLSDM